MLPDFFAAAPFKVQFRVMKFYVGSKKVLGNIHKRAPAGKFSVGLVEIGWGVQAAYPRLIGVVVGFKIEAFILVFYFFD